MVIEQLVTHNQMRNFNYLIVCAETGQALAIDPFAADQCLQLAKDAGYEITHILNTHEHWDHIGGNDAVIKATGAKVLAHHGAKDKLAQLDRGLYAGDVIKIGTTVEVQVLDTPGHTMTHVCLLAHNEAGPALFSGDTLFNAGCGHCQSGGHPHALFTTFQDQLEQLEHATRLYPGHDYLENNLRFSLSREPNNKAAKALLTHLNKSSHPESPYVTTLGEEKTINPFFRLENPELIQKLTRDNQDLTDTPTREEVFLALREQRNHW